MKNIDFIVDSEQIKNFTLMERLYCKDVLKYNDTYGSIHMTKFIVSEDREIYIFPRAIAQTFKIPKQIIEKLEYSVVHELIHDASNNECETLVHSLTTILLANHIRKLEKYNTWYYETKEYISLLEKHKINIIEIGE